MIAVKRQVLLGNRLMACVLGSGVYLSNSFAQNEKGIDYLTQAIKQAILEKGLKIIQIGGNTYKLKEITNFCAMNLHFPLKFKYAIETRKRIIILLKKAKNTNYAQEVRYEKSSL